MISLLITAAAVLGLVAVACLTLKIRDTLVRDETRPEAFFLRSAMLSPEERTLHAALLTLELGEVSVAAKVHAAAVIGVKSRTPWAERKRALARLGRAQFDFLLVRRTDGHPLLALELDRLPADEEDPATRDPLLAKAAAAAGLPVLSVPVRSGYNLHRLQQLIDAHLVHVQVQEAATA